MTRMTDVVLPPTFEQTAGWPIIIALFFFMLAPASGVLASYSGFFKTGLAIHSLWLAGVVIICIAVGLG